MFTGTTYVHHIQCDIIKACTSSLLVHLSTALLPTLTNNRSETVIDKNKSFSSQLQVEYIWPFRMALQPSPIVPQPFGRIYPEAGTMDLAMEKQSSCFPVKVPTVTCDMIGMQTHFRKFACQTCFEAWFSFFLMNLTDNTYGPLWSQLL